MGFILQRMPSSYISWTEWVDSDPLSGLPSAEDFVAVWPDQELGTFQLSANITKAMDW